MLPQGYDQISADNSRVCISFLPPRIRLGEVEGTFVFQNILPPHHIYTHKWAFDIYFELFKISIRPSPQNQSTTKSQMPI